MPRKEIPMFSLYDSLVISHEYSRRVPYGRAVRAFGTTATFKLSLFNDIYII